jgi:hypothetical protein
VKLPFSAINLKCKEKCIQRETSEETRKKENKNRLEKTQVKT